MGLYPSSFLSFTEASVANLVARHEAALAAPRLAGIVP
jgi:NADH-quinone oxidoreductase subunit M